MRASLRLLVVTLAGAIVAGLTPAGGMPQADPGSARSLATATHVERGDWRWPVDGARQVLRPFIAATPRWSAGHRGIDVRAWSDTLLAPAAGVVRFAGWVVDRPVLSIDHGGVISSYEPVATDLAAGDRVDAGQPLGSIAPGHCAARCVHVGVRVSGDYRNPLLWLGGVPRSVLLPTRAVGAP